MKKYIVIGFWLLAHLCWELRQQGLYTPCPEITLRSDQYSMPEVLSPTTRVDEFLESFTDDSTIGVPHRNKIELESYRRGPEGSSVTVKFYTRTPAKEWKLKQSFEFKKNSLIDCYPQIADFNNDGFKDFTFISNVAARGANEVRTLLIYDRKKDEMIHITNSEDYPNIAYNKKLDCIDAFLFHGATTTVFARLEGDRLLEFASVNTGSERIVTVIDRKGRERTLRREKMNFEDIYTRYETFDPPR